MTLKAICLAVLAGTAFFASTATLADDDDDDDHRKDRYYRHGKHSRKEVHFHHYYFYLPSGAVIERPGPPPFAYRDPLPAPGVKPGFPRESAAERAAAKERQRAILEKELAAEEQLLAQARRDGTADGIGLHERNIAALRRELANIDR